MAAPTATTEVPAGQSKFPPFQSEYYPSQFVWLTLSFALLYVLMAKLALPRIDSILAARSKRIAEDIATAQRFKERSEAASAAYEKVLADARARARSMANETRERQAAAAEETNKRLEAELHERLAAAERSIATTRGAAMANVGAIAADAAAAIVERLIGKAPAAHEVAAALSEAANR
jgi:F-type H+-transporting ATPase subunit b